MSGTVCNDELSCGVTWCHIISHYIVKVCDATCDTMRHFVTVLPQFVGKFVKCHIVSHDLQQYGTIFAKICDMFPEHVNFCMQKFVKPGNSS